MKVLTALTLVAAFALAQGRSAVISKAAFEEVDLGVTPYLVHLRLATGTTGFLLTGAGAFIHPRWVLTSSGAVNDARFIWIRFGAFNVVNPSLVTETSIIRNHASADLTLVSINRYVHPTINIQPIRIETAEQANEPLPSDSVSFSFWGLNEDLETHSNILSTSELTPVNCINPGVNVFCALGGAARIADLGSPLVVNGELVGILSQRENGAEVSIGTGATFTRVGFYVDWIEQETGLDLSNQAEDAVETVQVAEPEIVQVAALETVQVAVLETVQVAELRETVKVASL